MVAFHTDPSSKVRQGRVRILALSSNFSQATRFCALERGSPGKTDGLVMSSDVTGRGRVPREDGESYGLFYCELFLIIPTGLPRWWQWGSHFD